MRRLSNLLLACLLLPWLMVACSTTSQEVRLYQTVAASNIAVRQSLAAWGDYTRAVRGTPREVTLATHEKVKAAYDAYKSAALGVTDAALAGKELSESEWTATGQRVRAALLEFTAAVEAAKQ